MTGFRQSLADIGYSEKHNVAIDFRDSSEWNDSLEKLPRQYRHHAGRGEELV
jgi:hypothetical protein